MSIYQQEFLRPGRYDLGEGVSRSFTAEELGRIQANTQALLEAGYEIPVLLRHPAAGSHAGGPRAASRPAGQLAEVPPSLGRVVEVRQADSGALIHRLELPYEDEAELFEQVGLRHTSPELRTDFLDATGKSWGPIIAHVALTSRPRVHDQQPLARADGALRLSLRDLESQESTMHAPDNLPQEQAAPSTAPAEETTSHTGEAAPSSDAPLAPPAAGEAALGPEELPAELAPDDGNDPDIAPQPDRQRRYREGLAERIRQSRRLPLGLRQRLATAVGAVQLSADGDEEPSLKLSEAVELLEEALPEELALAGGAAALAEHPAGERFFTGESTNLSEHEAQRIAREQLLATGFARRG